MLLAQQAIPASLVSVYKPVLIGLTLLPYAWVVSSKLEKDAGYFNLGAPKWAGIFLASALASLAAVLFIPIFWVGWPVMMLVLVATLWSYMVVRNKGVPEGKQYQLSFGNFAQSAATRKESRLLKSVGITIHGPHGRSTIPGKDDPEAPAYAQVEAWVGDALLTGAWRVDIRPVQGGAVAITTKDGVSAKGTPVAAALATPAMDILRKAAGFDVADRRRPQRGTIQLKCPAAEATVTLLGSGGSAGTTLRLEFESVRRHKLPLAEIGFLKSQLELLDTFGDAGQRRGVVLVSAPPGHGLVTTLYALTARHDAYTASVKTFERQIEAPIEGVDQVQFDPANAQIDYATAFRSIIRRGPDVVLCSDASEKGIGAAVGTANTETLLTYAGMSAASSQEALQLWIRACGGDVRLAAKLLRAVISQRLVRRLCAECRTPVQVSAEQARKLGLPATGQAKLYRAGGKIQVRNRIEDCPHCRGLGYSGQVAVLETLPFPPEAKSALEMGNIAGALKAARKAGGTLLTEAALQHVALGTTAYEEVQRVFRPAAAPSKPAAGAGAPAATGAASPAAPAASAQKAKP